MSVSPRREYSTYGRNEYRTGNGVSAQTLAIAAVASAIASFAVSRLWGTGTLLSAAATPVIVALVSEALKRPVQHVAATARKAPTIHAGPTGRRRSRTPTGGRDGSSANPPVAAARRPSLEQPRRHRGSDRPAHRGDQAPADTLLEDGGEASRHRLRRVLITAIAAFAIVAAFYTISDALAGQSITGNGQRTTLFGGSTKPSTVAKPTTTPAPTTTSGRTAPATSTHPTTATPHHSATSTSLPSATTSSTPRSTPSPTPKSSGNSTGSAGPAP